MIITATSRGSRLPRLLLQLILNSSILTSTCAQFCCSDWTVAYGTCDTRPECDNSQSCATSLCNKKDWVQHPFVRTGCCSFDGAACSGIDPESNAQCQHLERDCVNCGGTWVSFAVSPQSLNLDNVPISAPTPNQNLAPTLTSNLSRRLRAIPTAKLKPTTKPTLAPTLKPTLKPTIAQPTIAPIKQPTIAPTKQPTVAPQPTNAPTKQPTISPTKQPTLVPTKQPSNAPTPNPTLQPNNTIFNGPFVTKAASSEIVTIPHPPQPNIIKGFLRTNCPEDEAGLLSWHNSATWSSTLGRVPIAGDNVILPANSKVVVTQSVSGKLGLITIPSTSMLVFAENPQGITLDVDGIEVQGSGGTRGVLRAGSVTCRYETDLTITLYGSRPPNAVTNQPAATYKGISVNGGTIDLHGERYFPTWTRLAKTVLAGQNYILLQDDVNWKPNHEIVLVTTAVHDSYLWHRNEVLIVSSVQSNPVPNVGSVVYVTTPVQYKHIANNGYQAEVGLLTRNIVVQGSSTDSEYTDEDPGNCVYYAYGGNALKPCPNYRLTGFGGHIIVHNGGKGYVEGVELYRMGQTNVLGRYPMHFHVLGTGCTDCYIKDSSIHRSFYRCVSIHGTHSTVVSENVAYDVAGYCYYLEDGVEENNEISYNLAAHINVVGGHISIGDGGQTTPVVSQTDTLTLPADITASGYYLTNLNNTVVGNAASGGWSGFALPVLHRALGPHKNLNFRPANRLSKLIDGNTAHSTGWWWGHAGAFYSGGSLFYDATDTYLMYNAGRDQSHERSPCLVDMCQQSACGDYCQEYNMAWNRISNSKVFLVPSTGLNSWSGRGEIIGFEAHDVGLGLEALSDGFGISNLLVECRSGEEWVMPPNNRASAVRGDGFFWYDTGQEHIITNAKFRKCGYRGSYDHYDTSTTRGCDDNSQNGCTSGSTVFGFLTHSDQFTPEIMQATSNISFENCGRRFKLYDFASNNAQATVSGRNQNWMDVDGSASGLNEPTIIGSGLAAAGLWWKVDSNTVHDPDGPLEFIRIGDGPQRGLGHMRIRWDQANIHSTVGGSSCGNGNLAPCPALGRIRHIGPKFDASKDPTGGLPITANPEVAGPVGGFGWHFSLYAGAPKRIEIDFIEVDSTTPMMLAVTYPPGTSFTIVANADWCTPSASYSCQETFHSVSSVQQVRNSLGNAYFFDSATNLLWTRIVQYPQTFTGAPAWKLWNNVDVGKWGNGYALYRYTFIGITLPKASYRPYLTIVANCVETYSGSGYCANTPAYIEPQVCEPGFNQVSYDKCGVLAPTMPPVPTPAPTPKSCPELVTNGGFEAITNNIPNGWTGLGATISSAVLEKHSGSASILVSGRTSGTWNSVEQSMTGLISPGQTYLISYWVKLKTSSSQSVGLTFETKEAVGGASNWIGLWGTANNQGWTQITGSKTLPAYSTGQFAFARVFVEGPAQNEEYWVDDVSIKAVC